MIVTESRVVCPWVAEKCEAPLVAGCQGIGLVQGGELVAGVLYDHYTGRSIEASIVVTEKARLNRSFLWVIFDYPFTQLAVDTILIKISSANKKSMRLAARLGFKVAGMIPDIFDDGDMILATLTKQDCKWLEKPHVVKIQSTQGS